jgi:hypothetical protein
MRLSVIGRGASYGEGKEGMALAVTKGNGDHPDPGVIAASFGRTRPVA